jgi:two-component system NtrC family sensor kinase
LSLIPQLKLEETTGGFMNEKKHSGNGYYQALRRKMVLLVIAVSLTPLILISSIMLYQFQVSYQEKVLAHLEEVVLKHSQNINGFLDEKFADIQVMARAFTVEQLRDAGDGWDRDPS